MKSNLSQIFRIQRFLNDMKYPDSYRIAREISGYLNRRRSISEEGIFKRLHKQEPWEYIKGNAEFCNNTFKVTNNTLIPRIETEQLVYTCREIIEKEKIKNIIDVGTGSGCIAISLFNILNIKHSYSIYATDISKEALKIAKKNEKSILKKNKIKWINTNLIEKIPTLEGSTLIIANLPYIPTNKYENLDKSVLKYEPRIALDGGKDGLLLYKCLFEQILQRDIKTKILCIETEEEIFKKTENLVKKYFPKSKITEIKDCFNKNRFLQISL